MILVDTSAWYSSACPSDTNYLAAREWLESNSDPLLTTDYIIDETLTLLRARKQLHRAISLGVQLFSEELATIQFLSRSEIDSAWHVFRRFADKEWRFTDCTSKVVMESLGITTAFSFDRHFRQFGSVVVVPSESGD